MEDVEFCPLVSFNDQSPSFVHGFEAGMIWQQMQQTDAVIDGALPVHVVNETVLRRMAASAGYKVEFKPIDGSDEWTSAVFTLLSAAPRRSYLRVVGLKTEPND